MELEILGLNLTCIVASLSNSEFPQNECLFPLLSKAVGYSIVAASIIVKVPQIYIILKNKSISGLSVASFELEVVGFTIALAYCLYNNLPFSAYGELLFLLIQAIILIALIYYFSLPLGKLTLLKSAIYCAFAPTILSGQLSPVLFEALYASLHALFLFARMPQIWGNYHNKSTGELSFLSIFISFGGCFARLFTRIQEKAPTNMFVGSVLGIIMNGILLGQIVAYNRSSIKKDKKIK